MDKGTIYVSAGRDYRTSSHYEFCIYRGEKVIARQGGFRTSTAAKRAGIKRAQVLVEA